MLPDQTGILSLTFVILLNNLRGCKFFSKLDLVKGYNQVPLLLHPHPQDVRGLQRFLGMINFYLCFLPGIARTLRPLTDALAGNPWVLN